MFRTILSAVLATVLLAGSSQAQAQADYPSKPVRIVVPSSAGGGTDVTARLLAPHLSTLLGQQFIIDNRPGAGGIIGSTLASRADPDGYTLLLTTSTFTTMHLMTKSLPFDPVKDLDPVSLAVLVPQVLVVNPSVPAKSVKEFIALARKEPNTLTYGSAGVSTAPHMAMELFNSMTDVRMVHVPSRGVAPSVTDLLGGRLSAMVLNVFIAKPHIEAGKLRALAVTVTERTSALPDVPTMSESGLKGYEAPQWFGLWAPAGTPKAILNRVQEATAKALKHPDVLKHLNADGAQGVGNTPDEFRALIAREIEKWNKVARTAGIKPK